MTVIPKFVTCLNREMRISRQGTKMKAVGAIIVAIVNSTSRSNIIATLIQNVIVASYVIIK